LLENFVYYTNKDSLYFENIIIMEQQQNGKKHVLLLLSVAISALFIQSCATSGSSTKLYGIERGSPPHAVVLDISGSMGTGSGDTARANLSNQAINEANRSAAGVKTGVNALDSILGSVRNSAVSSAQNKTTKLAEARRQLIPFINGLSDGTRFSITAFNSSYSRYGAGGIAADTNSRAQAVNFVNSFSATGGTKMKRPLEVTLSEGPKTIYLITDGKPSESDQTMLNIANTARARGIVINTIGIGEDQNKTLLQQMAQITGGVYKSQGLGIGIPNITNIIR